MPVVVRVVVVVVAFATLVGLAYALSAITGLEIGLADLIVLAVFAAIAIPAQRALGRGGE